MSTIALHSTLNISETVRDIGLVPNEMVAYIGYQMVTRPMTSRDQEKLLWGSTFGYPSDSLASCMY